MSCSCTDSEDSPQPSVALVGPQAYCTPLLGCPAQRSEEGGLRHSCLVPGAAGLAPGLPFGFWLCGVRCDTEGRGGTDTRRGAASHLSSSFTPQHRFVAMRTGPHPRSILGTGARASLSCKVLRPCWAAGPRSFVQSSACLF